MIADVNDQCVFMLFEFIKILGHHGNAFVDRDVGCSIVATVTEDFFDEMMGGSIPVVVWLVTKRDVLQLDPLTSPRVPPA